MNVNTLAMMSAISLFPTIGYSGDIATERTQVASSGILTFIQTATNEIKHFVEEIEDLESRAAEVLDDAIKDQLPDLEPFFAIFEDIQAVIEAGEGLAYTADDLEVFMKERFETYESYLDQIRMTGLDDPSFTERFKEWNNGHRDTIRNIMKAHGVHAQAIEDDQERLNYLQEQSRTADGRMQALQIGQEIATEEVKQLHKLREIIMEQSNLHGSYFAVKQAMDAEEKAATEYFLERGDDNVVVGDGKYYDWR